MDLGSIRGAIAAIGRFFNSRLPEAAEAGVLDVRSV
jgi:hypothetical protein